MIEVKSDYLYYRDMEEIFAKRDACIQNGYLFDIYVFNEKEFLMIVYIFQKKILNKKYPSLKEECCFK